MEDTTATALDSARKADKGEGRGKKHDARAKKNGAPAAAPPKQAKPKKAKTPQRPPPYPDALIDFMMKDWAAPSGETPAPIANAASFLARRRALSKEFPG
jgi:Xaa-Pro aminopeptidase